MVGGSKALTVKLAEHRRSAGLQAFLAGLAFLHSALHRVAAGASAASGHRGRGSAAGHAGLPTRNKWRSAWDPGLPAVAVTVTGSPGKTKRGWPSTPGSPAEEARTRRCGKRGRRSDGNVEIAALATPKFSWVYLVIRLEQANRQMAEQRRVVVHAAAGRQRMPHVLGWYSCQPGPRQPDRERTA